MSSIPYPLRAVSTDGLTPYSQAIKRYDTPLAIVGNSDGVEAAQNPPRPRYPAPENPEGIGRGFAWDAAIKISCSSDAGAGLAGTGLMFALGWWFSSAELDDVRVLSVSKGEPTTTSAFIGWHRSISGGWTRRNRTDLAEPTMAADSLLLTFAEVLEPNAEGSLPATDRDWLAAKRLLLRLDFYADLASGERVMVELQGGDNRVELWLQCA